MFEAFNWKAVTLSHRSYCS